MKTTYLLTALWLAILANEKHAAAVKLTEQERIDLYAWVDLSAPRKDRCDPPYWYTAEMITDNEAKASGVPFITKAATLDKLTFQSWGSTAGTDYVDDVVVSREEKETK